MAPVGVQRPDLSIPPDGYAFNKQKHIKYWKRCLKTYLPEAYTSTDSNRMMLGFFILSSLDLLGALQESMSEDEHKGFVDWIYSCQHPEGGFRGFPGTDFGERANDENKVWDPAHVPATYLALSALLILRDPLERVRRRECLQWLRRLQRSEGSFGQTLGVDGHIEGGTDSRFGYCACMVRFILRGTILGDVEGVPDIDVDNLVLNIMQAQTYDGGISEAPFHEAHGGFTYCAISALSLVRRLPQEISSFGPGALPGTPGLTDLNATIGWLVSRQTDIMNEEEARDSEIEKAVGDTQVDMPISQTSHGPFSSVVAGTHLAESVCGNQYQWAGFNGRCNKIADTCYCFWVGGALSLLHHFDLIDQEGCRRYLLDKTQHLIGGFGKNANDPPDIYHSCLGLTTLSLLQHADVKPVVASTCFSQDTMRYLENLSWRSEITGNQDGLPQGFVYSSREVEKSNPLQPVATGGG